ncbi:MAG: ATP-binding cassette domain-containing protein [Planctomycetota bacterium]|nr:ATP-binding cassette domain-containing protein [Planctomycetota bacterium]MDA1214107.1 ATP-binding cassette domain-containing protein [Planctomycetota bacterium]
MPASGSAASESSAAISVRRLNFAYAGDRSALTDVSFDVQRGEIVAIVGPSGAGKSTLLMHLNGLLPADVPRRRDADEPAITIAGQTIVRENLPNIRRFVGFLFQDPDDQLFCPTVGEDVAFGPLNLGCSQAEVTKRVIESLTAVNLADAISRSTLQLSMGERKRVCLAGVLACRPEVLALDEPFSNLDPRARNNLLDCLRQFDGTIVLTTHDLDVVVEFCTRVLVLDNGCLHADGPPAEILANSSLMQRHGLEVPFRLQSRQ